MIRGLTFLTEQTGRMRSLIPSSHTLLCGRAAWLRCIRSSALLHLTSSNLTSSNLTLAYPFRTALNRFLAPNDPMAERATDLSSLQLSSLHQDWREVA